MPTRRHLCTALVALALCGCGQKGPLYLPQDPAVTAPPPGSAATAGAVTGSATAAGTRKKNDRQDAPGTTGNTEQRVEK